MLDKIILRKKKLLTRKKNYFDVNQFFFKPVIELIENNFLHKSLFLSLYLPSNYEVNTLGIFKLLKSQQIKTLLPVIISEFEMKFEKWKPKDVLRVNKFGMLEPIIQNNNNFIPDVMLLPLIAYDKNYHRLGYGKGYYDRFLNKYLGLKKNILTIGVAFSDQKYNKIPINKFDVKLDHILTEKGLS
jgi:5-formyltetrahydrofolate cyclo-ligase